MRAKRLLNANEVKVHSNYDTSKLHYIVFFQI